MRVCIDKDKVERLVRVAVIEGNIVMAQLLRILQPASELMKDSVAYTDGKVIYVGKSLWDRPLGEQYFIINHEFLHIILKHAERKKDKEIPNIYNIAADIIINDLLKSRKRVVPDDAVTYENANVPRDLDTTEKIYEYLLKNRPDMNGDVDLIPDAGEPPQEIIDKMASLVKEALEKQYSKQTIKEKMIAVPQDFSEKIDWFNSLMAEIGRIAVKTYIRTYTRPSRIKIEGCLLKGGFTYQHIPKINVIIDVSSSMGDEPLKIAAKIQKIQKYLKVFKTEYYWLNTNHGKINDIKNIPLGGGTDLSQIVHIKGADMNVLLTDCEDESGVDVINNSTDRFYIITNNSSTKIRESNNHKILIINNF